VDSLLIEQVIDGDEAAFKKLYDMYKEKVYRIAWMLTNNESAAQDIIQEVFIQVYLKIPKLKYIEAFESWLYKITVNCSEGTVKSRLFNSKKILEKKLSKSKKYNLEENVYEY